jgi:hypothetical protein
MAYSRIAHTNLFLPELTHEILQYFRYDYKTLHSCILVNKLWCRLAIPILWEDPLSNPNQHYEIIKICLRNLSKEDKNQYFVNGSFPNTLFNYPSFIKHINTYKVGRSIEILFMDDIVDTSLAYWLFFKTIIENAKLHSFEIILSTNLDYIYFYGIYDLILWRPNFFYNIKNFTLHLNSFKNLTNHIFPFLSIICKNCYSITSIDTQFHYYKNNSNEFRDINNLHIEEYLSQIIYSQKNLKKILFEYNTTIPNSLLTLKNSNSTNTLTTMIFYSVNFQNILILNDVFNHLNVLESIHLINCYLDSNFIYQIINVTNSFKLKTLFMDELLELEYLKLLLQKFGNYIENFGVEIVELFDVSSSGQDFFEIILKFCNNIKILNLPIGVNNENINSILRLIDNISFNLNYLSIDVYNEDFENIDVGLSSSLLKNLGQILPKNMEYLCLNLMISNLNDLEIFLRNSQNTFIKKLLIRNEREEDSGIIFPYIMEYIIKKRRVKYLALEESYDDQNVDLFFIEDIVKECESYDVQILNYDKLFIQFYEHIKEIC